MSQGEKPPFLDRKLGEEVARAAAAEMRRRVEATLALNVPLPVTLPEEVAPVIEPVSVRSEDVHARTGSPEVSEPSEPASRDDQSGQILGGRRRARKGVKNVPQASEPVVASAVAADNPDDEAAEIERLVKAAAAAEAAIAKESSNDPIVLDAQAPGQVPPRRRPLPLEPAEGQLTSDPAPEKAPVVEEWTRERLLAEIPDQAEFQLTNPKSAKIKSYKRVGDDIVNDKGVSAVSQALGQLNKKWEFSLIKKAETADPVLAPENPAPVAAEVKGSPEQEQYELHQGDVWVKETSDRTEWITLQDVAGANVTVREKFLTKDSKGGGGYGISAKRLVEKLRSEGYVRVPDILDGFENQEKSGKFLPLEIDQEARYFGNKGETIIVEHTSNGYRLIVDDDMVGEGYDEEHIQNIAREEDWVFISQGGLISRKELEGAPLAIGIPEVPPKDGSLEIEKDKKGYGYDFRVLKNGEEQHYLAGDDTLFIVRKKKDGYYFVNGDGELSGPITQDAMRHQAEAENWRLIEDDPAAPVKEVKKAAPEKEAPLSEFYPLQDGERQKYFIPEREGECTVEKFPEGYRFYFGAKYDPEDEPLTIFLYSEDEMRRTVKEAHWEVRGEILKSKEVLPDQATPAVEVKGKNEGDRGVLQEKIDVLKTEVAEFRYKYAEMDYEKTSAWKTLKGFFRNMTPDGKDDADTAYWSSEYHQKLMTLQNLELEQIKQSGLKGEALKERMAGLLQYYKYEQATALYNDRTQVRMDRQNFVGKAWGKWEEMVKGYGKLSLSKKVLIGVGLFGVSVATGGVGAAGVLVLRRMMGATGLALTTDALLEGLLDKKSQEKAKKEIEQFQEKNFDADDSDLTFQKYASQVSFEIERLNRKLQDKKLLALARKELSLGAGALGMLGGSLAAQAISDHWGTSSGTEGAPASSVGAASAPEAASSVPAEASASGVEQAPSAAQETPDVTPAETQGFKVEFERYQVTDADGKRGLWGILEQHLPEDMLPQAEKNRIIQSLENIIQQKLDHMSAAEFKEVGFPKGNVGQIYAGTEIDLGRLLTPDEIQAVMEGKDVTLPYVEAPSHVGGERLVSSPVPDTAHPVAPQEAVSGQATALQSSSVKPAPVFTPQNELIQKNISFTDPKAYLTEHPENLSRYNSTLGRLRMGIFMMNPGEAGVPIEYDYTLNGEKLGSTKISQVLQDLKGFDRGVFQNLDYDRVKNPLHYDQMKELGKFMQASEKAFGPQVSLVEAGESIDHYTRRMATAALRTGKEIKGFYKP